MSVRVARVPRKSTCAPPAAFTLRRAQSISDFEAVAELCASEFDAPDVISGAEWLRWKSVIPQIGGDSLTSTPQRPGSSQAAGDLLERLVRLDKRKTDARDEQHSYAASKRELKDAANQARIEGKHQYADELELLLYERGRGDRRKMLQWRFKRQSMIIIAEEASSAKDAGSESATELAGSCAVVLKILESFLPPPFPSRAPARLYIGNLVVQESQRRQGCGTALLQAVEKLGRRWRHREVWLHVDVDNTAAVAMYKKAGFVAVKRERESFPPFKMRYLMKKSIQKAAPSISMQELVASPAGPSAPLKESGSGSEQKVFVWDESDG